MELKSIALILAIVICGIWVCFFIAALVMGVVQGHILFGLIGLPAAVALYILLRLIAERLKGDRYDNIEE